MGATNEQHPGQSNGDRESRSDLRIRYWTAGSNPRCLLFVDFIQYLSFDPDTVNIL